MYLFPNNSSLIVCKQLVLKFFVFLLVLKLCGSVFVTWVLLCRRVLDSGITICPSQDEKFWTIWLRYVDDLFVGDKIILEMFSIFFFCCFYFDYWFMINAMILLKRYLLHYSFGTKVHNSITFHFTPSWSHIDLSVGVLTCFAGTFPIVIHCTRQLTSPWAIVIGSEHYVLGEC
jgi:hypothetical protein